MTVLHRIACVMLLVLGAGCSTVPKSTSTRLPMREPYRLLLVYPDIQVRELTADGAVSFRTEWADEARLAMAGTLRESLAAKTGLAVEIVGSEQAGADPELVGEVHLRHDALGRMVARPKTVGTTLGDAASKLGEATKSELLFMMHADFTVRTTGRKALIGVGVVGCSLLSAGLLGGTNVCSDPDAGDYSAYASLVDGDTGEILWTTVAASGPGDLRREKATRKLAKALTKKLPNLKPAVDP
ncbi:MAG: hypothetical protein IPM70_17415 [Proteobacteria bacterium]|jgi:hypothetical protein|nr:hypothetical protein [Pseudomonadota bacterium]MCC6630591.1 hypothetical protein [Gammaproteobacteria bacterium]